MKKSLFYLALFSLSVSCVAADLSSQQVTSLVKAAIEPLMEQQEIPGMSVAVLYKGRAQFVNFGVADLESRRRVTENTLFELGSVSKTFTGTLAGVMIRNGEIRLNDPVQKYWPQLTGEQWRPVRMLHLATIPRAACLYSCRMTSPIRLRCCVSIRNGSQRQRPARSGSTLTPASVCLVR